MSNSDAHDAYVLREYEKLMTSRLENTKGEIRHRAEIAFELLAGLHSEATMNKVGVPPEISEEDLRIAQEQSDAWIRGEGY